MSKPLPRLLDPAGLKPAFRKQLDEYAANAGVTVDQFVIGALTRMFRSTRPNKRLEGVPLAEDYRRWTFTGHLDAHKDARASDVEAYIYDAVGTMCGCYRPPGCYGDPNEPGDPMWNTQNVQEVKVALTRKRKKK